MVDPRLFAGPNIGELFAQGQQFRAAEDDRKLRLGEMMRRQQEQQATTQREAGDRHTQTLSRMAQAVRRLPYEGRRAAIQQLAPQLQQMGLTPQDIEGFDPSDQQLDAYIALGGQRGEQVSGMERDYEFIRQHNPALADQYLRNRAEGSPVVANNGDGTFTIVPRSQIGGGQPAPQEHTATNPQTGERLRLNPQTGQWEPIHGGASPSNGSGNFPQ